MKNAKEERRLKGFKIASNGGQDGCINYADQDNSGLHQCIAVSKIEEVYQKYCELVSLADFIVIAAEAVMGRTATVYDANNYFKEGTLARSFRDRFAAGRTTLETCPDNLGFMPDAELGCDHVNRLFTNHIFKNARYGDYKLMTPAIQGAHTIGQAKIEDSGYNGAWTDVKSFGKFNNDYYRSMLARGWGPDTSVNGNPKKN